jgi:Ser/Thr protein kinase RdoA (MazF antagonist)
MKQAQLERVLSHYNLGSLQSAQRVERGYVNENWLVATDCGRYFLKRRHPDLRHSDRIAAQHHLLTALSEANFPVPLPRITRTGQTWLALEAEVYELYDCVEAQPYNHQRSAHLTAAAQTLGQYHTLAVDIAPAALQNLGDLYHPAHLHPLLAEANRRWAESGEAPLLRNLQAHAAELILRAKVGLLPQVTIHGDYYAGNLLFQDDQIVCVVDWDKARRAPRVVELAEALIYFASPQPGTLQNLVYRGVLQWGPLAQFLHNYTQHITLQPAEIEALPNLIQCIWLEISLKWLLENPPPLSLIAPALGDLLTLSDWAHEHRQRLRHLARTANQAHQEEPS